MRSHNLYYNELTNLYTKMSIHMFHPVVFLLKQEVDLQQHHMAI